MVVVWLKRDLRLLDHEPLVNAIHSGKRILFLYSFEPFWTTNDHHSEKHLNFIKQSVVDMNLQLALYDTKVLVCEENIIGVFDMLNAITPLEAIFSYQESGMQITYNRDKQVAKWCQKNTVLWRESVQNGVFRGIPNRKKWRRNWVEFINEPVAIPQMDSGDFLTTNFIEKHLEPLFEIPDISTKTSKYLQKGGVKQAKKYLDSFLTERINGYNAHYSKPATSRKHSSRLSPYLAWGNLSARQVCQYAASHKKNIRNKRNLGSFLSRMRWQAHFIQKFEMEIEMETQSVNAGYHQLTKERKPHLQKAWREGQTGIPMVDAAMRCLVVTGFVNFRLRAMLASFFTHLLWQPWQDCTEHLAQNFLDFEPGIHFPQLNMQSGETGVNTIRIYNPVKNGKDHDPKGVFIKKWVPELTDLPEAYIHEPWLMPPLELKFLNFNLGGDYPHPIVNIEKMRLFASDTLYAYKKRNSVKKEGKRIVEKHTIPNRAVWNKSHTKIS
jgi:deoxyribodipyrimidine photo-lyase